MAAQIDRTLEQVLINNEILELKYKKSLQEKEELEQRLLVAEQIIRERKWAEWKVNGE